MASHETNNETQLKIPLTAQLQAPIVPAVPPAAAAGNTSSWISSLGLLFLAVNCGVAIYNSRGDRWSIAFVAGSFTVLVLLFHFLRIFESVGLDSSERGRIKAIVWSLSTILTVMFSCRVAALMPPPVAVIVWAMAGSTVTAGFCMFFVCKEEAIVAADEKPPKNTQDA